MDSQRTLPEEAPHAVDQLYKLLQDMNASARRDALDPLNKPASCAPNERELRSLCALQTTCRGGEPLSTCMFPPLEAMMTKWKGRHALVELQACAPFVKCPAPPPLPKGKGKGKAIALTAEQIAEKQEEVTPKAKPAPPGAETADPPPPADTKNWKSAYKTIDFDKMFVPYGLDAQIIRKLQTAFDKDLGIKTRFEVDAMEEAWDSIKMDKAHACRRWGETAAMKFGGGGGGKLREAVKKVSMNQCCKEVCGMTTVPCSTGPEAQCRPTGCSSSSCDGSLVSVLPTLAELGSHLEHAETYAKRWGLTKDQMIAAARKKGPMNVPAKVKGGLRRSKKTYSEADHILKLVAATRCSQHRALEALSKATEAKGDATALVGVSRRELDELDKPLQKLEEGLSEARRMVVETNNRDDKVRYLQDASTKKESLAVAQKRMLIIQKALSSQVKEEDRLRGVVAMYRQKTEETKKLIANGEIPEFGDDYVQKCCVPPLSERNLIPCGYTFDEAEKEALKKQDKSVEPSEATILAKVKTFNELNVHKEEAATPSAERGPKAHEGAQESTRPQHEPSHHKALALVSDHRNAPETHPNIKANPVLLRGLSPGPEGCAPIEDFLRKHPELNEEQKKSCRLDPRMRTDDLKSRFRHISRTERTGSGEYAPCVHPDKSGGNVNAEGFQAVRGCFEHVMRAREGRGAKASSLILAIEAPTPPPSPQSRVSSAASAVHGAASRATRAAARGMGKVAGGVALRAASAPGAAASMASSVAKGVFDRFRSVPATSRGTSGPTRTATTASRPSATAQRPHEAQVLVIPRPTAKAQPREESAIQRPNPANHTALALASVPEKKGETFPNIRVHPHYVSPAVPRGLYEGANPSRANARGQQASPPPHVTSSGETAPVHPTSMPSRSTAPLENEQGRHAPAALPGEGVRDQGTIGGVPRGEGRAEDNTRRWRSDHKPLRRRRELPRGQCPELEAVIAGLREEHATPGVISGCELPRDGEWMQIHEKYQAIRRDPDARCSKPRTGPNSHRFDALERCYKSINQERAEANRLTQPGVLVTVQNMRTQAPPQTLESRLPSFADVMPRRLTSMAQGAAETRPGAAASAVARGTGGLLMSGLRMLGSRDG